MTSGSSSTPVSKATPLPQGQEEIALTFILPTRNRRQSVRRAIESCLRCHQPGVAVEVLILDGQSTDGSFEELQRCFGEDPRVRLLRQHGAEGFMPACLSSVPLVHTTFATFMYDDDVLSPFWVDLPHELNSREDSFVMGFGAGGPVLATIPFQRVNQLKVVSPGFLLRAYCGWGHLLSSHGLPFSPICCLTRTEVLREWVLELARFTKGRPLREYFWMRRAAGPDLLIYFLSIAKHRSDVTVFDGVVAQFSTHEDSMTCQFERTDLSIGYWLARAWLCDRLRRGRDWADAGGCAAYTVREGVRLLVRRLSKRRWEWLGSFAGEVLAIGARTLASRAAINFVWVGLLLLFLPRRMRPHLRPLPRIESPEWTRCAESRGAQAPQRSAASHPGG